jgi:glycosyltransferase involved in cell wall biosynthesis
MEKSLVAIVIPAFNESKTILRVVIAASKYGVPIVVDDGSCDETQELAESVGALTVKHKKNLGYDAALNTGFNLSNSMGFKYCVTFDADGQHDAKNIKTLLFKLCSENATITVGIRPYMQRSCEYFFGYITQLKYGIKDPLCGLKAYDLSIYKKLGYFDSYKSIGTELMLFALSNKANVNQTEIRLDKREDKPRFSSKLNGNRMILRSFFIGYYRYIQGNKIRNN